MPVRPSTSFLDHLPEEDYRTIAPLLHRRTYGRGDVVFRQGDRGYALYLVVSGRFAVRASTAAGDEIVVQLIGPGETFGEMALVSADEVRSATVEAADPSVTLSLHRDAFEDLRARRPSVDRLLVAALAQRVRSTTDLLLEAAVLPAETRVFRRLRTLVEAGGDATPIELRVTQDDLARLAGTTRPTVNRALQHAQAAGLVKLGRGTVTVLDRSALDRRCSGWSAAGR